LGGEAGLGFMHKPRRIVTNHASRDKTLATASSGRMKSSKPLIFIKIH
jgi:hypothetical protein